MSIHTGFKLVLAILLVLLIASCSGQRVMMPTPNVYVGSKIDHYQDIHPNLKSTEVRLFYITDREPERDENGNLEYGYGRSHSLAFGSTVIDLGENLTWEELLEASRTDKRLRDIPLNRRTLDEIVRGPKAPIPYNEVDGKIVEDPEFLAKRNAAAQEFREVMVKQLDLTPRKEVFIFVHGFHNDFNDAAFVLAELWHFVGRVGVPILYTWPAGHPGLFGYTYDRESSEFTVYHFRQVVEFISTFPEVEKIHIIAHSWAPTWPPRPCANSPSRPGPPG